MAPSSTSASQPSPHKGVSAVAVAALAATVAVLGVGVGGFDAATARGIAGMVGLVFVAAQVGWLAAALVLTALGVAGAVDDSDQLEVEGGAVHFDVALGLIGVADNDDVELDIDNAPVEHTAQLMVLRRAR